MTATEVAPAEISPLKASRLTDQVYEAITARILNGTFRPGDRLDVNWLAEKLEVSPTPVKNALSLLANEGLVQILPRNGTFVTQVSRRSLEEALSLREAFELLAADTLIDNLTPELLAELTNRVDAIQHAPDVASHYHRNTELHQRLVEVSGNQMLAAFYRQLHAHIHIALLHARSSTWKARAGVEADEHRAIVNALAARDVDLLKSAIRAHLKRSRKSLLEEIRTQEEI